MKKHIPNSITLLNIACGSVATAILLTSGDFEASAILIIFGLLFDFSDGFVARLLHVKSELGKELDSMADMVSFGVFPGAVMYTLMRDTICAGQCTGLISSEYFPFLGFLITVFSGYRLAKFNIDTRQTDTFIGVPTPITALLVLSLLFIRAEDSWISQWLFTPKALLVTTVVLSYLLNAEFELLSLKFGNRNLLPFQIVLIIVGISAIIVFHWTGVPILFLSYLLLSVLKTVLIKNHK